MVDYNALLLNPTYLALGVCATITPKNGFVFEVTAIDRTAGVEVNDQNVGMMTVRPAATVRMSDLNRVNLKREDLRNAKLVMNGKTWRVENTLPRPTPNGAGDGELFLYLIEN